MHICCFVWDYSLRAAKFCSVGGKTSGVYCCESTNACLDISHAPLYTPNTQGT